MPRPVAVQVERRGFIHEAVRRLIRLGAEQVAVVTRPCIDRTVEGESAQSDAKWIVIPPLPRGDGHPAFHIRRRDAAGSLCNRLRYRQCTKEDGARDPGRNPTHPSPPKTRGGFATMRAVRSTNRNVHVAWRKANTTQPVSRKTALPHRPAASRPPGITQKRPGGL